MESLKPLKIIGALALLCLIVYLAIPDGRLNTLSAFRSLGFPKYNDNNSFKGENAEFFSLSQNLDINLTLPDVQNQQERRMRYLQLALKSNDPILIGFASRNGTVYSTSNARNPAEQKRFLELLDQSEKLNLAGMKFVPDNAFFPLQLATIADSRGDVSGVKKYVALAANCKSYSEYPWQEPRYKFAALVYEPSVIEKTERYASVLFKNLSSQKATIKRLIGSIPPQENIEDRINVIKVGRLMALTDEIVITPLVGKSIVKLAVSNNYPDSYIPKAIDKKIFAEATKELPVPSQQLVENAIRFADSKVTHVDPYSTVDWQFVYLIGPLITRIPILVFALFVTLTVLLLATQKIADRPWVKSIRYLALVPLSLCLAQNESSFNFHVPTVVTILVMSIPVALIALSEKFVPVIHITIVVISLCFFERGSVLTEVLFHVSLMAALVILTWHKNRKPDTKFSRNLSNFLVFAVLGTTLFWASAALKGTSNIASLPMVLACICFSTLAIVDSDRQQARRQATIAACIGLACFAATSYLSLKATWEIVKNYNLETKLAQEQAKGFAADFPLPKEN